MTPHTNIWHIYGLLRVAAPKWRLQGRRSLYIYIYIYIYIYCVLYHEVFFLDNNSISICMSVGCCRVYRQSWQLSVQPDCTAWSNIRVPNRTAVTRRLMANSYSRVDVNMQGMLALNWVYCYSYYYYYYWLNNLLI